MKLVDICSILVESDELKRGWYKGEEYSGDEDTVEAGNFKIRFKIYQETVNSPTRHYRDSPPESETYTGDVTRITITTLECPEIDIPDLDFGIEYKNLSNPNLPIDLLNHINDVVEGFDPEDKQTAGKLVNYLKSKPEVLKALFTQIISACENVYKGEI